MAQGLFGAFQLALLGEVDVNAAPSVHAEPVLLTPDLPVGVWHSQVYVVPRWYGWCGARADLGRRLRGCRKRASDGPG